MTYRPTPTMRAADGLLHSSTRTTLSTNADAHGLTPPRIVLRVSKLEILLIGGDAEVRFSAHETDVSRSRSRPARWR
ncbi:MULTISPECIES: hypothetical protein [unclassified Variovorax]|uniref:hypothetical protein n=1 Tax=unclassified Variovorax TaxID=663243 RepID=UPI000838AEEE|nr:MULTISPECIES: hypothetical protein [unclassified Variovorax]